LLNYERCGGRVPPFSCHHVTLDCESIGTYLGRTILDRILRAFAFPLLGGISDVD